MENALACLAEHKEDPVPARIGFTGGYLMLQEGVTKGIDVDDYEAQPRYLDVQVLVEGIEMLVWSDISALQPSDEYDPEKDKAMYTVEGCSMTILPGTCYVF